MKNSKAAFFLMVEKLIRKDETRESLIGYCELHCKTPRALFNKTHIALMIYYANCEESISPIELFNETRKWYSLHGEMERLVILAREQSLIANAFANAINIEKNPVMPFTPEIIMGLDNTNQAWQFLEIISERMESQKQLNDSSKSTEDIRSEVDQEIQEAFQSFKEKNSIQNKSLMENVWELVLTQWIRI